MLNAKDAAVVQSKADNGTASLVALQMLSEYNNAKVVVK